MVERNELNKLEKALKRARIVHVASHLFAIGFGIYQGIKGTFEQFPYEKSYETLPQEFFDGIKYIYSPILATFPIFFAAQMNVLAKKKIDSKKENKEFEYDPVVDDDGPTGEVFLGAIEYGIGYGIGNYIKNNYLQ